MSSEETARRLVMAAGGLAAVGLVSLGATFMASDDSTSQPAEVSTPRLSPRSPLDLQAARWKGSRQISWPPRPNRFAPLWRRI